MRKKITTRSQVLGILVDSFPTEVKASDLCEMLSMPSGTVSALLSELKNEGKVENNKSGWFLHNIHAKGFYVEVTPGSTALITVNEDKSSYVIKLTGSDCVLVENVLDQVRMVYQN